MTLSEYQVDHPSSSEDASQESADSGERDRRSASLVLPADYIRPEVHHDLGAARPISKVQSSSEAEVLEPLAKVIGIDKLWLSAPLRSFDEDPQSWSIIKANGWLQVPLYSHSGSLVYVRVFQDQAVPWTTIQFNPSRLLDPQGLELAPIRCLPDCITEALTIAGRVVEIDSDLQLARVKRVDLSRDFVGVTHIATLIKGFMNHPRPFARFADLSFGSNGVVEGIQVGSDSGGKVLLCDKFMQSRRASSQGILRYEAQCKAWATQAGIKHVRDLTEENLARLAWDRWHWAGFGSYVTGAPEMLEIVNRSGYPDGVKRALKGNILLESHSELGPMAPATRSSYNKKLKELGIVPSTLMELEPSGSVHSLDLLGGTAKVASLTEQSS